MHGLRQHIADHFVGLESFEFFFRAQDGAFVPGLIAVEQFEALADFGIGQRIGAAVEEVGFHASDDDEVPGRQQHHIEEDHLNGSGGAHLAQEVRLEFVEFILLVPFHVEVASC